MTKGSHRDRAAAFLLLLLLLGPASRAFAQAVSFTSDVGLMVLTVRADRVDQFEQVFARLVGALKAGARADTPVPAIGLRMLRSGRSASPDQRLFVVLLEPVSPSQDYSVEQLLRAAAPAEAADLIRQFRESLVGEPFIADLRLLHSVKPEDVMRSRLEAELAREGVQLGLPAAAGANPNEERNRIERLRLPVWSVQHLDYRATETTGTSWRFAWSFELMNGSLTGTATADIAVDFLDQNGAVLQSARVREAGVPVGDRRKVSGDARIPAALGTRVVAATVRIDSRP